MGSLFITNHKTEYNTLTFINKTGNFELNFIKKGDIYMINFFKENKDMAVTYLVAYLLNNFIVGSFCYMSSDPLVDKIMFIVATNIAVTLLTPFLVLFMSIPFEMADDDEDGFIGW